MDGRDSTPEPSWWAAPDAPPPAGPPPAADAGAPPPVPPPLPDAAPAPGYAPPQNFGPPPAAGGPPSTAGGQPAGHPWADPPVAYPPTAPAAHPTATYPTAPYAAPTAPYAAPTAPYAAPTAPYATPYATDPGDAGRTEVLQTGAVPGGPRRRGTVAGIVVGVLVVALVVGVGGLFAVRRFLDGRDAPANWREPITAYCRQMDRDLKAAASSAGDDQAARLKQVGAVLRTMNSHLRELRVATDQRTRYDRMLDRWDDVPKAYDEAVAAAARQDQATIDSALSRADRSNDEGNAIANQLGLPVCAGAGGLPDGGSAPTPSPSAVV